MSKVRKAPPKVYNVHVDGVFKNKVVAQILGREGSVLKRTIEVTLADLVEDYTNLYYQYIKLKFQIVGVDEQELFAKFKGHELTRDYVRSLVRVGTSAVYAVYDFNTTDNIHFRIQVLAITAQRVSHSKESAIRKRIWKVCEEKLPKMSFDEAAEYIYLGKLAADINQEAKKVYPLKKVEVIKSKVLTPFLP